MTARPPMPNTVETEAPIKPPGGRRVLGDSWYGRALGDICTPFEQLLADSYHPVIVALAKTNRVVRSLLLFRMGRSFPAVLTTMGNPGAMTTMIVEALFYKDKRRVIVLEFIRRRGPASRLKQLLYPLWMKYVLKPVLRRSLRFGHVLTVWEKEHYAARYDMPVDRFVCVPWFLRWEKDIFPAGSDRRDSSVVSSGRVACDWETLFRAARDRNWNLTVICSRYDLARVEALGCFQNVRILSEISREEHQRYVENAAIYVLCLQEEEMSSGQVRLMDAVRGGTPVVATRVKGLEGYIAHEETGILVNPGDHVALRNAIDRLLGNEDYRCRLARNAFDAAGKRTREHYLHHLQAHVAASIDGRG